MSRLTDRQDAQGLGSANYPGRPLIVQRLPEDYSRTEMHRSGFVGRDVAAGAGIAEVAIYFLPARPEQQVMLRGVQVTTSAAALISVSFVDEAGIAAALGTPVPAAYADSRTLLISSLLPPVGTLIRNVSAAMYGGSFRQLGVFQTGASIPVQLSTEFLLQGATALYFNSTPPVGGPELSVMAEFVELEREQV